MDRLPFTAAAYTRLLVSQRGVTEHPPGSNRVKYALDQGIDGQPWCAALTGWGFDQLAGRGAWRAWWASIGCTLPYYTPALATAARKAGLVVTSIRAGDLLFWDFPDSVDRVQHVDVALEPPKSGQVITIGGNTSPDNRGSQSNGGGVFERRRNLSSLVAAVRLPYAQEDVMAKLDADDIKAIGAEVARQLKTYGPEQARQVWAYKNPAVTPDDAYARQTKIFQMVSVLKDRLTGPGK